MQMYIRSNPILLTVVREVGERMNQMVLREIFSEPEIVELKKVFDLGGHEALKRHLTPMLPRIDRTTRRSNDLAYTAYAIEYALRSRI